MPAAFRPPAGDMPAQHSRQCPRVLCRHASCFRREKRQMLNGHDDPGENRGPSRPFKVDWLGVVVRGEGQLKEKTYAALP